MPPKTKQPPSKASGIGATKPAPPPKKAAPKSAPKTTTAANKPKKAAGPKDTLNWNGTAHHVAKRKPKVAEEEEEEEVQVKKKRKVTEARKAKAKGKKKAAKKSGRRGIDVSKLHELDADELEVERPILRMSFFILSLCFVETNTCPDALLNPKDPKKKSSAYGHFEKEIRILKDDDGKVYHVFCCPQ